MNKSLFYLVFFVFISSCVNTSGVAEFQVYQNVFTEADKASEEIIVILRSEERNFLRTRIARGKQVNGAKVDYDGQVPLNFDPRHSTILSDTADPPYTDAFKRSVRVLREYNETLLKYSEGAALETLQAQAVQLRTAAFETSTAIAKAAGTSALVSNPLVSQALVAIEEIASQLARTGSREAFRRELTAREPQLQTLLDALIETSSDAYLLMTTRIYRQIVLGESSDIKSDTNKIHARQKMLAEWVFILQRSKAALSNAVTAAENPRNAKTVISDTALLLADVKASVKKIEELSVNSNEK